MFRYGNQVPAFENEKNASQMIIELQNKNVNLRFALARLAKICVDTGMHNESEVWAQQIGFAKQILDETDPNKKAT